jgi:hypothetical protein
VELFPWSQAEAKQKEVDLIRQELEGVRSLWQKTWYRSRGSIPSSAMPPALKASVASWQE